MVIDQHCNWFFSPIKSRNTASEVLEAVFDDYFGLSDGELNDEEEYDVYAYLGEPRSNPAEVTDQRKSVSAE